MTIWTSDELDAIGAAEELKIATLRSDGTLRKPVTVWVVRHGPDLCVRSGYENGAAWFRAKQAAVKVGSRPVASRKTSVSRTPAPPSTTRSTPPTAPSTAITARAGSIRW